MPEVDRPVAGHLQPGRGRAHSRRRLGAALCVAAVVVGLASAGSASAVAATKVSAPASIAATATLPPSSTTIVPVTATDGTGAALPGATIYLKFGRTTGGGSASVSGTSLTGAYQPFVTNGAGQVPVTYSTPAVLPGGGHDIITAANATTVPTSTATSQYLFTTTAHYRITPEPIGAPGSLPASTVVPMVVNALDAAMAAVPAAQVCVNMVAAAGGGTASVGAVMLTSKFQCFTTDSAGKLAVTYTTPATLPTTGTDVITAQDTTGSLYNASAPHGYSYGQLARANLSPTPIAVNHSLAAGSTVAVMVTPKDASGAQVAGATVQLSLQTSSGARAMVIDYSSAPDGQYLNATPKSFLTHTKTRMTIYYTLPNVLPATGVDRLVATVTSESGVTTTTMAAYAYGHPELLARDTTGALWRYPGDGTGGWLPRHQVGTGWNSMTALVAPGDFNGDAHPDLLARDTTGALWLYPGNGTGGWLPRHQVGTGWNSMTALVAPGDFNGDAHPDLLARDTTGALWLYPGNGTGGWLPRRQVGTGWNSMTALVAPGDFNGDGHPDLLARDTTGALWLYPGDGTGGWLPRRQVGTGWNSMTALVAIGDFDGDGHADLLARDTTGALWLYAGDGTGGWLPRRKVGTGWNSMTALV